MAKTLRVRTRTGWVTKPAADAPENRLVAEEVDDNFLALEQEDVSVVGTTTTAAISTFYVLTADMTLTLPATPSVGDWVKISNRSGVDTCIVARNGSNIMGLAEDMVLDVVQAGFTLTYADATNGWVIT